MRKPLLFNTLKSLLGIWGNRYNYGHSKIYNWSYIFHRLTGLGVLAFLLIHIIDTALIGWGPEVFNRVMSIYKHPFFRVSEIFLFGAVLYHSLNGLRITLIDLWPGITRHYKKLLWGTAILFVLLMIPVTVIMLHHALEAQP